MDKLKLHSKDITAKNIAKLAALFPNCVTETKAEDGSLKNAIDFDLLRQELSADLVEGAQERYRLDWPGKREALATANAPIAKTLRPGREESVDFDSTKNLYIEGDNLEALKLLQETYLNKVKMIYIDPPYNTGNDFVYDDDFAESSEDYFERSNQTDAEGNRLVANTEANGRFHSDWLTMMFSRLRLARNLLTDDGAIFISIDDGEAPNLRKICDEVFGESHFQADISWQKRYTRSNNTIDFTTVVEHLIVYSKSNDFEVNLLPRSKEADDRYTNPDGDKRGPWKGSSMLNPATPEKRPNLCYPIVNPNTGSIANPTTNAWRRSKEEFERLNNEKRLYWGLDGGLAVPSIKMFLSEARGLTPVNFWEHTYAGNTDQGTAELNSLMGVKLFDNPKPTQLIIRALEHGSKPHDIILDFFSGSATTAHAVMQINAMDGGCRRHIMVQLPEVCDHKSPAFNAGYKTIADIGKERIRRAGAKIRVGLEAQLEEELPRSETHTEVTAKLATLDTGFRVLKVSSSNMPKVYYRPDEVTQDGLDIQVENIKPDRTSEDLLFQVLLDWGVDLASPIRKIEDGKLKVEGKEYTVFVVGDNDLVACFDTEVTESLIKEVAKLKPLRVVFRDASFVTDATKINIEQIFKALSPHTELKSI